MANRLVNETSPYLRQHAGNPVDWFPWGDDAFDQARRRDVPLLLSVGYSSCHWCHVMAHESFEDPDTAELMNDKFVNVKVDREERPDVDAIYMEATQAMTGSGGWPMTVFMTPDGAPFFCGTYFPSDPSRGTPTFTQVINAITDLWDNRRTELLEQAGQLVEMMQKDPAESAATSVTDIGFEAEEVLREATMSLLASHDPVNGGFGTAPKFPASMSLDFLLRHHARTGSASSLEAVVTSLDAMAAGGIYDHIGGGFSRYSVDQYWLAPHFEKMLYDNALLARTYLHAWQVTGEERFLQVCSETIAYVLGNMSHPSGGRYSAEDADSPVEDGGPASEGAFYLWNPDQVAAALGASNMGHALDSTLDWYGILPGGNFEGRSIPNRISHRRQLERPDLIELARQAMFTYRKLRPRPGLDDKVLTEWNAFVVELLAEAGAATGHSDWITEAERTAEFLCNNLRTPPATTRQTEEVPDEPCPAQRWLRSWQGSAAEASSADVHETGSVQGMAKHLAYGSDYAALVNAFIALYEATGKLRWLSEARQAADGLLDLFWDPRGAIWTTGKDAPELVVRPKDITDDATPSANSLSAVGLLRLEAHTGRRDYGEAARAIITRLAPLVHRHPRAFAKLLEAVELDYLGITEIVISGGMSGSVPASELVRTAQATFLPRAILAWGEPGDSELWEGRVGSEERAYVCRNQMCGPPAATAEELLAALAVG